MPTSALMYDLWTRADVGIGPCKDDFYEGMVYERRGQ